MPTATLFPTRPLRPLEVRWFLVDPLRTAITWEGVLWPAQARWTLAEVAGLQPLLQPILNEWGDL